MEVGSHGSATIGANKEADKVAPPFNVIATGENTAALPSAGMADASKITDALNSSAGTNTETIQASDAQQAPVSSLSPAEDAILALTQDPAEGSTGTGVEGSFEIATDAPPQEPVDASALEPAGVAAGEVPVMHVEDAKVVLQPSEVLLPADEQLSIVDGTVEMLATPQVEAAIEPETTLAGTSGVAADKPLEGEHAQEEEPAVVNNEVSEQDIQSIKGQKVMKKFGKKNYMGDVVDYDPELKWFKIVYEDGDEEDLEVEEVKPLLVASGTLPASTKKRVHTYQGADEESKKSSKKPKKSSTPSSAKKRKGAGAKTVSKSPKTPGSHGKSAKKSSVMRKTQKTDSVPKNPGKSETEDLDSRSFTTPVKSETRSEEKSKVKSETATPKSSKADSAKVSRSVDVQSPTPQKVGKAKMTAESSGKKKGTSSAKKKGTKSPNKGTKVQQTPKSPKSATKRKAEGKEVAEPTNKRSKKGVSETKSVASGGEIGKVGDAHHVGKPVRKDFGGTLYDGVVVKFDKKTKYYKVRYDDSDEEDLELSELEPILVPERSSTDDDSDEKPAKLSSLSTLMSQEDRVVT